MHTDLSPQHLKAFGLLLIAVGVYMFFFGGTTDDGGTRFTLFGFEFGERQTRRMTPGEQRFGGLIFVGVGVYLLFFA